MREIVINFDFSKTRVFLFLSLFLLNSSCRQELPEFTVVNQNILLDPDYTSVTIPPNIAPLNFRIDEIADRYLVKFYNSKGTEFFISSGDGRINIPQRKWSKLISHNTKEFYIDIFLRKSQSYEKFNTITNYISRDSIDKYMVYRLIEPGFEAWNKMGIYQRNLENFKQTPVMVNNLSNNNCMNCHTFCKNSNNTLMFHMRGEHAGTFIYRDNKISRINLQTKNTISQGVYPAWHPSGNYIAYSVNLIGQMFHSIPGKKIEVFDSSSDIIVYDLNRNLILSCPKISETSLFETFPTWSPDGRYLYFCCAKKEPADKFDQIRYDLKRIEFDTENSSFGAIDTVIVVSDKGKSISFPRISPDGKYLLFCKSDYGNFSIWHSESDLFLIDLSTGQITHPAINSDKTESFHSWSSSGRWIVFSSRRGDGLYTKPYFSYFDSSGIVHKPFVLPQKNPKFYFNFMKSYNLPEFVTSRIELNPREILKTLSSEPLNVDYIELE